MLNLIKSFDKYEKKISDYIEDRISSYFSSAAYKGLKTKTEIMNDSYDMKWHGKREKNRSSNEWLSKIGFPLVREAVMIRRAALRANFRADPLLSLEPAGSTSYENAQNASEVLNQSLISSDFRAMVFSPLTSYVARYGAGVVFSRFNRSETKVYRTTSTPFGPERQEVPKEKTNVLNECVDPLNYFQNPSIAYGYASDYQGFVRRWYLSSLIAEVKKDETNYIRKNLVKVIEEAKKAQLQNSNFHAQKNVGDWKWIGIDLEHWYGKINIADNEDDETIYYVEKAGDKIVRLQTNPNDDNLVPLSIFGLDARLDYWWGNSDAEAQRPFENYLNFILSLSADNALREMEKYIFFPQGQIDIANIQNAHKHGGFVGVDIKNIPMNQLFHEWKPSQGNINSLDWIVREVKEASQRVKTKVDLQRQANQGGLQNKTLGAAQMVEQQGNIEDSDFTEEFAYGLKKLGYVDIILLQQHLPDVFAIRPKLKEAQKVLNKLDILGNFRYKCETSLTRNKIGEVLRLQNVITGLMNMMGTGNPAFANIKLQPIIKEFIKKLDLPADADEVYPEQQAMAQMPGAVPSMNLPGQEQAGAVQELVPQGAGVGA